MSTRYSFIIANIVSYRPATTHTVNHTTIIHIYVFQPHFLFSFHCNNHCRSDARQLANQAGILDGNLFITYSFDNKSEVEIIMLRKTKPFIDFTYWSYFHHQITHLVWHHGLWFNIRLYLTCCKYVMKIELCYCSRQHKLI